ncbi:hypothetical protein H920_16458 [Fukomys damarensis]|uniref:Uncharacterized protein n=1 Tax=Fukomys damarensis TaxID=885580 RepID=A0A091CS78_FUKDA|nr:hypothetical protein H920_16458 [Fukomys damarensis]
MVLGGVRWAGVTDPEAVPLNQASEGAWLCPSIISSSRAHGPLQDAEHLDQEATATGKCERRDLCSSTPDTAPASSQSKEALHPSPRYSSRRLLLAWLLSSRASHTSATVTAEVADATDMQPLSTLPSKLPAMASDQSQSRKSPRRCPARMRTILSLRCSGERIGAPGHAPPRCPLASHIFLCFCTAKTLSNSTTSNLLLPEGKQDTPTLSHLYSQLT